MLLLINQRKRVFLIRKYQLINVEETTQLQNYHLATITLMTDNLHQNHQCMLKTSD